MTSSETIRPGEHSPLHHYRKYSKPPIRTLYVFLHGLICLVDVGKLGFLGYMLDVGKDHKYLCGNWLLEKEVKEQNGCSPLQMQLVGVQAGEAKLDEGLNFIVRLSAHPNPSQVPLRAVITLPRPKHIYHFNQGEVRHTSCSGETSRFSRFPTIVSGLRVFEYRFENYRNVALLDNYGHCVWECPPPAHVEDLRRVVATVHIYDEPEKEVPAEHNLQEFNTSLQFLGVNTVTLLDSNTIPKVNDLILPGVLPGETSTLDERDPDVLKMIFQVRRGELFEARDAGSGGGSPVCGGANGTM